MFMRSVLLLAATVFFLSCDKGGDDDKDCKKAICTMMFSSVNVNILDADSNAVKLSEYYTINIQTNDTIRHTGDTWPDGAYVVLDDSYTPRMYNKKYDFRFVGISNGAMVVNEIYTISADCCHINKVSGKTSVVVK